MTQDVLKLADVAERYMDSVKALFAIDPTTKKCFAEGSPTKDQETYERFVAFNNVGKHLSETIAALRARSTQEGDKG